LLPFTVDTLKSCGHKQFYGSWVPSYQEVVVFVYPGRYERYFSRYGDRPTVTGNFICIFILHAKHLVYFEFNYWSFQVRINPAKFLCFLDFLFCQQNKTHVTDRSMEMQQNTNVRYNNYWRFPFVTL